MIKRYSIIGRWQQIGLACLLAGLMIAVNLVLVQFIALAGHIGKGAFGCGQFDQAVVDNLAPGDTVMFMIPETSSAGPVTINKSLILQGGWLPISNDCNQDINGNPITPTFETLEEALQYFTYDSNEITSLPAPVDYPPAPLGPIFILDPSISTTLTIQQLRFHDNRVDNTPGAGISGEINNGVQVLLEKTRFERNVVTNTNGGGLALTVGGGAHLVISDTHVVSNTSTGNGGGLALQVNDNSQVLIHKTQVSTNTANNGSGGGGRLIINSGVVTITESAFFGNKALNDTGGGLYAEVRGGSRLIISDTQFFANEGGNGGGFWIEVFDNSQVLIYNTQVATNSATGNSGGGRIVVHSGSVTVTHSSFSGNEATGANQEGGGLAINGPNGATNAFVWVSNSSFQDNTAPSNGGGLRLTGDITTAYLHDNHFSNNVSGADGGGLHLGNPVGAPSQVWLARNRFNNNEASGLGGGLHVQGNAMTVYGQNNLLVNNIITKTVGNGGGGLAAQGAGSYYGYNDTIYDNREEGVYNLTGTIVLTNAIIWGNASQVAGSPAVAISYSTVEGGYPGSTNIEADPAFEPALDPATAAYLPANALIIDGGTPVGAPIDDFLSQPRLNNPDMGAFEALATDLRVIKSATPSSVRVSQPLTYVLTVTNDGPLDAAGVILTDLLSSSVEFSSVTPGQPVCAANGGLVTCQLGNLANGASQTVTLVATPTTIGVVTNTARVVSQLNDSDLDNSTATVNVSVNDGKIYLPAVLKN